MAAQHYAFAVEAFVQLLKEIGQSDYQASLKEMRTYEVIEDVANLHSEIGIVYLSRYNRLHQLSSISSIGQKYLGYLRESIEKNAKRQLDLFLIRISCFFLKKTRLRLILITLRPIQGLPNGYFVVKLKDINRLSA